MTRDRIAVVGWRITLELKAVILFVVSEFQIYAYADANIKMVKQRVERWTWVGVRLPGRARLRNV